MCAKTIIDSEFNRQGNSSKNSGKYTQIAGSEKPLERKEERNLVGFLVSYSKSEAGEYWPIREGRNSIGSFADNSIILIAPTVSDRHATLMVRRSKKDSRLMFIIKDENSTNGVFVNNEDIEYQPKELNERDIVKIGDYEILVIIIDKIIHKLETKENLAQFLQNDTNTGKSSPYDYPVYSKNIKGGTIIDK